MQLSNQAVRLTPWSNHGFTTQWHPRHPHGHVKSAIVDTEFDYSLVSQVDLYGMIQVRSA